jgi:hypothetical protein
VSAAARDRDGWTAGYAVLLVGGLALLVVALPLAFSGHIAATFFGAKLFPLYAGAGLVAVAAGCFGSAEPVEQRRAGRCSRVAA